MSWQVLPYTVTLFLAALVSIFAILFALRIRIPSGARTAFIIFMSGVALWSLCYALEVASFTLERKLFWANMQYLGVLTIPPALLFFMLRYTSRERWITATTRAIFAVVTLVFVIFVWTDQYHHLLRVDLQLGLVPFPELVFEKGPAYQGIIVYFYLCLLLTSLTLIRHMIQSSSFYRGQSFALLVALTIPWGASVLEVLGVDVIPHLSPVVFSFIISGGIFIWALWHYRLLDILPVAQHAIFENLPDGIIVLDSLMRVSNINPAACRMLAVDEKDIIGTKIAAILPALEEIIRSGKSAEISLQPGGEAFYEILVSELFWESNKTGGFLLVLRDTTQRKQFEQALRNSEMQYRSVCERANDGIAVLQGDEIKYINPQLRAMLGYELGKIIHKPFLDFISPQDRDTSFQRYHARVEGNQVPSRYEIALLHKSGKEIYVEINASLTEYQGLPADLIFIRDMTEQKRIRDELKAKNRQMEAAAIKANLMKEIAEKRAQELETLQQATQVVSSVLEQGETIQRILEQLVRVVAYDSASVQLQRGDHLEIVGCRGFADQKEVAGLQFPIEDSNPGAIVFKTGKSLILADVQQHFQAFDTSPHNHIHGWMGVPLTIKNHTFGIISLDSLQADYFNEEHARLVSVFANQIAVALENTRLFSEVRRLAITDPLTNLYNRRHFYSLTLHEFLRFQRYKTPFSVIMLDADHFKQVNDSLGHLAGDKVLQHLADLFRENMRNVDILCRFGGEEFIATLPETHASDACALAERLRQRIESTQIPTHAGEVSVTVSIGVTEFTADCGTIDKLLDHADKALYAAKMEGRNRVSIYYPESAL